MEPKKVSQLNSVVKKTKGRQKIDMKKKMSNERNLQVTFSKRRSGIFKKASELSTLCGVDIAIIIFSPSNRVFSFGSPNVDSVIQRYSGWVPPHPLNLDLNKVDNTVDERELHTQLVYVSNQILIEKKREENMDNLMKVVKNQFWWANPIESMNGDQLKEYKNKLEELKTLLNAKREKQFFESILSHNSSHFFAGGSSSSNVGGPMTMHSTPLMQNREGVINGSVIHHHYFNNMNGQGNKDGPFFRFF